MPAVFINYRTGDGKDAAAAIYQELARRFGPANVFLAGQSINGGENYVDALHGGVRRSSVLLALIGSGWLDAPDQHDPARRALESEADWVRREIEDAFAHGVTVVPVLLGRRVEQLPPERLPASLSPLAERQYMRYTLRTARHDLTLIGDWLARHVPALAEVDKGAPDSGSTAGEAASERGASRHTQQRGGIGDMSGHIGSIGSFVGESHGPLHTGSGDQIGTQHNGDRIETQVNGDQVNGDQVNGTQVNGNQNNGPQLHGNTGDGTVISSGDNAGGQQHFGPTRRRKGNER